MKRFFRFLTVCFVAASAAVLFSTTAFAACDAHQMDSGIITEQPTCERIGIVTYTCLNDGCDYSYVEKMGNLGHHYENGLCTTCGSADPFYVPSEPIPTESTPVSSPAPSVAPVPEPEPSAVPEWEPPFVNPTVAAHESITLAAPTAGLTAVPATGSTAVPASVFLITGMILILFSAAAVVVLIRKAELAR